ncbi:MAG: sugar-binding protein [Planctomycetota bacterium]
MGKNESNAKTLANAVLLTTLLFLFGIVGLACGNTLIQTRAKPSVPTLKFTRTGTPPVIDADLSDTCWKRSVAFGAFVNINGTWSREQTEGFLAYDDAYLYVAARCHESQVNSMTPDNKSHDDPKMALGDCLEIYFDVDHGHNAFYHLMINQLGNIYEASCDTKETVRDISWNPDCKVATTVGRNEWMVELAIPFASLSITSPMPGTTWGFNLNRERHRSNSSNEYGSWAMTKSFNDPTQFGNIVFGSIDPISSSFIFADDSHGGTMIKATIRNNTASPMELRVQTLLPELPEPPTQSSYKIALAPLEEKQTDLTCNISSQNLQVYQMLNFRVSDAVDKKIYLQKTALYEIFSPLTLIPDCYYYPADCNSIVVQVTAKTGKELKISVRGIEHENILVEKTCPILPGHADYNVSIPAADLDLGRYVITATIGKTNNNQELTTHRVIYKTNLLPPKPFPSSVKSTSFRHDGVILINNSPFCPFLTTTSDAPVSPLADNSFNVNWGNFGLVPNAPRRVKVQPYKWVRKNKTVYSVMRREYNDDDIARETLQKQMSQYLAESLVFNWTIAYEAQIPMYRDEEQRIKLNNSQELKKFSDFIKGIDPNHPTSLQVDDLSQLALYKDCTDMMEVASWNSSYSKRLVSNIVNDLKTVRSILGPAKPVLFYIRSATTDQKKCTPEEIRCAAYLALMHRMNGLIFHVGHDGIDTTFTRQWSLYRGLAHEIEFIYPVLISQQSQELPKVTASDKNLDFCVKRYNNGIYLIACNKAGFPITPTFTFTGKYCYSQANLPFEYRRIVLTDGTFSDEFMPYETRVYEIITKVKK